MLIKNRFNHNNKVKTVLSLNIISNHNFSTFIKDLYPIFYKGIKEQMNTITNSYNKWLYLFHILVAKITRKTEITKRECGYAPFLVWSQFIFHPILDII